MGWKTLGGRTGGRERLGEDADPTEPLAPASPQLVAGDALEVAERGRERRAEQSRGLLVVGVRAPRRLRDDPVDDAELEAVPRVGPEGGGRLRRLRAVAPEDGGAALG